MLNPILASSATRRMRSPRTAALISGYGAALLLLSALLMKDFFAPRITLSQMGQGVTSFLFLTAAQAALLLLVAPAMTAGAVAGERERQTLELLLVTNTGSFRIVAGKLMESCAFLLLLVFSSLPALCLPLIAGGVGLAQLLEAILFLMACAVAAASVGLLSSCLARTTVGAAVLSYVLLLLLGAASLLPVAAGYPQRVTDILYDPVQYARLTPQGALERLSPLLFFNPAAGLYCLLESQTQILHASLYHGWGRLYATYLLLKKIGLEAAAFLSLGALLLGAGALTGFSALLLRPRAPHRKRKKS